MKKSAWGLLIVTVLLSLIGLLFVFEASTAEALHIFNDPYYFLKQQAVRLVIGWAALFAVGLIPYRFWKMSGVVWYVVGVVLLLIVLIPGLGLKLNGAKRWLDIGGFVLQPVEIMKFGLVVFFAQWLTKHQRIAPFLLLTAIPAGLVLLQPDVGSLLLVVSIAFSLFFLAGGSLKSLSWVMAAGGLILAMAIVTSPYRLKRVTTFINPESDPLGSSFHVRQITLALGNGGWFGQGLGNSRQKYAYIPEASTDSIFAITAEELGFVGSVAIFFLFWLYFWYGFQLIKQTTDPYTRLMAAGMLTWVVCQLILNLAALVALVPLTGVPLPFFSYGGSAQIMILLATGVLLRTAREQ